MRCLMPRKSGAGIRLCTATTSTAEGSRVLRSRGAPRSLPVEAPMGFCGFSHSCGVVPKYRPAPQRGAHRTYDPLAVQNHRNSVHGHAQRIRQRIGGQPERIVFIAKNLAWVLWATTCSSRSCSLAASVIVDDLDIAGPVIGPSEADAPLRVDSNAVLAGPIAPQRLQPVAPQDGKVLERLGAVQQSQATVQR